MWADKPELKRIKEATYDQLPVLHYSGGNLEGVGVLSCEFLYNYCLSVSASRHSGSKLKPSVSGPLWPPNNFWRTWTCETEVPGGDSHPGGEEEREGQDPLLEEKNSSWGYGNRTRRCGAENWQIHVLQDPWTLGLCPVKTVYSSCLAWPALSPWLPWVWEGWGWSSRAKAC